MSIIPITANHNQSQLANHSQPITVYTASQSQPAIYSEPANHTITGVKLPLSKPAPYCPGQSCPLLTKLHLTLWREDLADLAVLLHRREAFSSLQAGNSISKTDLTMSQTDLMTSLTLC